MSRDLGRCDAGVLILFCVGAFEFVGSGGGGGARSGGFTRFALLGVAASRVQGFGSKVVRLKFRNLALRLDLGARGKVEGSG